jgi:hypothetical protein
MTYILNSFNNFLNVNIKNKKNSFNINKKLLNKESKKKLIMMQKLNIINVKLNKNSSLKVNLKFFESKFVHKNINKWK